MTRIAAVLAGLAGLVGYVLVIGGVVVGARVERDGLSSEAIVTATPHDELFVYGIETLAAWVLVFGVVVVAWLFVSTRPPRAGRFTPLVLGALAAILALVVGALFQNSTRWVYVTVLIVAVSLVLVGLALTRRQDYLQAIERRLSAVDAAERVALASTPPADHPRVRRLFAEERRRLRPQGLAVLARLSRRALIAALIAYAAIGVGTAAVIVQLDRAHAYNKARVTLENGTCLEGAYITRNDNEILIAGWIPAPPNSPASDKPDKKPSLVTIRRDETAELQIVGPRRGVPELRKADCGRALTKPTAGEAPPAGEGAAGPAGPAGPTGPAGAAGAAGSKGPAGRRGPRGRHGGRGERGPRGRRGARGDRGPRGRRGRPGRRARNERH